VQEWRRRQATGENEALDEVVGLTGCTENCLGLTGWTTGSSIAAVNFEKNMIVRWGDREQTIEEAIEGEDAAVIRQHIEATHGGEFLGIPFPPPGGPRGFTLPIRAEDRPMIVEG
jgi:hypothetical protein